MSRDMAVHPTCFGIPALPTPTMPSQNRRPVALGLLVVGIAHLVASKRLLGTASVLYGQVLAVDFSPRDDASRRVRLIGVVMVAAGVLAWRLDRRP